MSTRNIDLGTTLDILYAINSVMSTKISRKRAKISLFIVLKFQGPPPLPLKTCYQGISNTIIARSFKLGQLMFFCCLIALCKFGH